MRYVFLIGIFSVYKSSQSVCGAVWLSLDVRQGPGGCPQVELVVLFFYLLLEPVHQSKIAQHVGTTRELLFFVSPWVIVREIDTIVGITSVSNEVLRRALTST